MNIQIAMTVGYRIHYLMVTLETWKAAKGFDTPHWVFRVEPSDNDREAIQMVREFPVKKKVQVNDRVHGPLMNPYLALNDCFVDGADFVILAEDDSIVSPDIMQYFRQMAVECEDDKQVYAVCGFTRIPRSDDEQEVFFQPYFASCVWGTWRDRWDKWMRDDWDDDYRYLGWDHHFVELIRTNNLSCVFPSISRVQHIGQFGGAHMIPADYDELKAQRFLSEPSRKRPMFKGVAP